ncbi:MAG TPA: hypothetical protein VNO79_12310 [Actinomycetota bacterium]|nr:hypothetical protein [Actinomycetota bacterium]
MSARPPVTLTITFGPSRSPNLPRALAHARRYASSVDEPEPGRYAASFRLAEDHRAYGALARLLHLVERWRATEVEVDGEPYPAWLVAAMAWCAREQLRAWGTCRFRYYLDIPSRCRVCPHLDLDRALRQIEASERERAHGLDRAALALRLAVDEADPDALRVVAEALGIPDHVPDEWTT